MMSNLRWLRKQAHKICVGKGHDMSPFKQDTMLYQSKDHKLTTAFCRCRTCGRGCMVDEKGKEQITGEATTDQCYKPDYEAYDTRERIQQSLENKNIKIPDDVKVWLQEMELIVRRVIALNRKGR